MKRNLISIMSALLTVFGLVSSAFAHPGHDHDAPSALPLHIIFYGSIAAIVGIAIFTGVVLYKRNSQISSSKDK